MKVKLTKGELKRQRDALRQYQRYLPTLVLKKQQLQIEIIHQSSLLKEKEDSERTKLGSAESWIGLLSEDMGVKKYFLPKEIIKNSRNVAGVDVPVFSQAEFNPDDSDLFFAPLWYDAAIDYFKAINSLRAEISVIKEGIKILKEELRITTQRVNLFEKVKIPQAQEAIRVIKIYIGDQMTNAVGRSKIAKRKIEDYQLQEALV